MDNYSAGCISFVISESGSFPGTGPIPSVYTANNNATDTLALELEVASDGVTLTSCISLKSGCALTLNYNVVGGSTISVQFILVSCDYDGDTGFASVKTSTNYTDTLVSDAVPQDGIYFVILNPALNPGSPSIEVSATIVADDTMAVNPVVALYDSGDPAAPWVIDSCPRLFLPPLTEITGDWYVNLAAGTAVLASTLVSNCVGYIDSLASLLTFTATDGGTDLTFDVTASAAASTGFMWGSVNAVAGETLTATFSTDAGTPTGDVNIYDYAGTLVEALSGASALTSAALPYAGRYTVSVKITNPNPEPPFDTATAAITSSGTLSVNPIQALYDLGLTCPGRIDCT